MRVGLRAIQDLAQKYARCALDSAAFFRRFKFFHGNSGWPVSVASMQVAGDPEGSAQMVGGTFQVRISHAAFEVEGPTEPWHTQDEPLLFLFQLSEGSEADAAGSEARIADCPWNLDGVKALSRGGTNQRRALR